METCIVTCTLYNIWNGQTKLSYSSETTDYNTGNSNVSVIFTGFVFQIQLNITFVYQYLVLSCR